MVKTLEKNPKHKKQRMASTLLRGSKTSPSPRVSQLDFENLEVKTRITASAPPRVKCPKLPPIDEDCSFMSSNDRTNSSSVMKKLPSHKKMDLKSSSSFAPGVIHLDNKRCIICKARAKIVCGGCEESFYCSKQHQATHWGKHKASCRMFSIPPQFPSNWNIPCNGSSSGDNAFRLYAMTTRKIQACCYIFREFPLIWYPVDEGNYNLCCYSRHYGDRSWCPKCGIGLCSSCVHQSKPTLDFVPFHSTEECNYISNFREEKNMQAKTNPQRQVNPDDKEDSVSLKDLVLFRALLLQKSQSCKWEYLMSLKENQRYKLSLRKSETSNLKSWMKLRATYKLTIFFARSVLKEKPSKVDDLIRIVALFSQPCISDTRYSAVYNFLSWIPHVCDRPNAEIESFPNFEIGVRSVSEIKQNTKICMNYVTPETEQGMMKTAVKLYRETLHVCQHIRCTCKSAQNDFTVGIKCSSINQASPKFECGGCVAPKLELIGSARSNLNYNPFIPTKRWECSLCHHCVKFKFIEDSYWGFINKIEKDLKETEDPASVQKMLCRSREYFFPNNMTLVKVERKIVSILNENIVGNGLKVLIASIPYFNHMERFPVSKDFSMCLYDKLSIYGINKLSWFGKSTMFESKCFGIENAQGLIENFTVRYGPFSKHLEKMLEDCLFTYFVILLDQYKFACIKLGSNPASHMETATSSIAFLKTCTEIMKNILLIKSRFVSTRNEKFMLRKYEVVAKQLEEVYEDCILHPKRLFEHMNQLFRVYNFKDSNLIANSLINPPVDQDEEPHRDYLKLLKIEQGQVNRDDEAKPGRTSNIDDFMSFSEIDDFTHEDNFDLFWPSDLSNSSSSEKDDLEYFINGDDSIFGLSPELLEALFSDP